MTESKIRKMGEVYQVRCHLTGQFRNAMDCKECHKRINIDPVKAIMVCKN